MLDSKFLALEYKTERIIVGSINNITQIKFPVLTSINSKDNPQSIYTDISSPL